MIAVKHNFLNSHVSLLLTFSKSQEIAMRTLFIKEKKLSNMASNWCEIQGECCEEYRGCDGISI